MPPFHLMNKWNKERKRDSERARGKTVINTTLKSIFIVSFRCFIWLMIMIACVRHHHHQPSSLPRPRKRVYSTHTNTRVVWPVGTLKCGYIINSLRSSAVCSKCVKFTEKKERDRERESVSVMWSGGHLYWVWRLSMWVQCSFTHNFVDDIFFVRCKKSKFIYFAEKIFFPLFIISFAFEFAISHSHWSGCAAQTNGYCHHLW